MIRCMWCEKGFDDLQAIGAHECSYAPRLDELYIEIADLRRELDVVRQERDQARAMADKYADSGWQNLFGAIEKRMQESATPASEGAGAPLRSHDQPKMEGEQ